jgi:nucleotide-binding universal stress UspA family protein
MIKDILVNLTVGKPNDIAGDFAISVAEMFDAHLSAVAAACKLPVADTLDGISATSFDAYTDERQADAEKAKRSFDERARRADIRSDSSVVTDFTAEVAQLFAQAARHYDLSVVAQEQRENDLPESLIIEAALLESGRPVLVVPYIQKTGIKLDRVMLCWDGSKNASRALADSMPLLERAGTIDVVTVEAKEQRSTIRGAQIADHLARHGFKVELKPIVAPEGDVANVLLSRAADSGTDLMVMGGYGHSRLREFLFGGATKGMLEGMTVPVLMSH